MKFKNNGRTNKCSIFIKNRINVQRNIINEQEELNNNNINMDESI